MACLRPIRIPNPSLAGKGLHDRPTYSPEYGNFLFCTGALDAFLYVPCRRCLGCAKEKQRSWRQRIVDEHSVPYSDRGVSCKYMLFVTFTIKDEDMPFVSKHPKQAFRQFFEAYRRRYGHSCRHFVVSEHAPDTGRLHFHGVLFLGDAIIDFDRKVRREGLRIRSLAKELDKGDEGRLTRTQRYAFSEELEKLWPFGWVDVGYNSSGRAASYCSKYITKEFGKDLILLVSQGFGKGWLDQNKKRLIAEGRRKAVHDNSVWGKFLCKYYRNAVFDSWWRQSDLIAFYTDPIPPDVAWRRNPLSERFSSEEDYRRYIDSLGSGFFDERRIDFERQYTARINSIVDSRQTEFEITDEEIQINEKIWLLSKKLHSALLSARITRFLTL